MKFDWITNFTFTNPHPLPHLIKTNSKITNLYQGIYIQYYLTINILSTMFTKRSLRIAHKCLQPSAIDPRVIYPRTWPSRDRKKEKRKKEIPIAKLEFLPKSSIEEHPLTESRRTACRRVDPGTNPISNKDPSSRSLPYPPFSLAPFILSLSLSRSAAVEFKSERQLRLKKKKRIYFYNTHSQL